MNSKLYVSDLDYTLLRRDQTISSYTKKAINILFENNILFTVASARNSKSMIPILEGIKLHLPIIEYNGGFITELETGNRIITNSINTKQVNEILKFGKDYNLDPVISVTTGSQDFAYYPIDNMSSKFKAYIDRRLKKKNNRLKERNSNDDLPIGDIMALTYVGDREDLLPLKNKFDGLLDFVNYYFYENEYDPGTYWLSVHDKKSSKENAIKQLKSLFKLNETELIVFGDNVNDIGMFKLASRGYAVDNATSELKKIATNIINNHENDSVADFILKENNLIQNYAI